MLPKSIVARVVCGCLILSGCAAPATQEQTGMVVGGVLGGALGSGIGGGSGRTTATAAGAILGAILGGSVGRSMDERDRIQIAHALESGHTGTPSHWRNPDSGNQYSVTPTRTYDSRGTPCREFTVNGVVGGKKEQIYGNACRQADGSWRSE